MAEGRLYLCMAVFHARGQWMGRSMGSNGGLLQFRHGVLGSMMEDFRSS